MKAAEVDRYGPPSVVEVRDVERPTPTGDEVLVKVHAASVNRADLDNLYPRWQFLRLFLGIRAPRNHRIGADVAGVVEAVGPKASRFTTGDRVFGDLFSLGGGAFAEFVAVPERALALIGDAMSFEQAATLPHAAVLAVQGLRLRRGRQVAAGDQVMVVGASGNVGPFCVQIAKSRGAEVTAVVRAAKADFASSLGADHVVDYETQDPRQTGVKFDWIVDVDAKFSLLSWRHTLKRDGAYVALGGDASWFAKALLQGPAISLVTTRYVGLMLWWKPFFAADVEELKRLVATEAIKPRIDRQFSLDDVVDALRYVDEGHARGKVLVIP